MSTLILAGTNPTYSEALDLAPFLCSFNDLLVLLGQVTVQISAAGKWLRVVLYVMRFMSRVMLTCYVRYLVCLLYPNTDFCEIRKKREAVCPPGSYTCM
jgi:hypothetical protein